MGSYYHFHAQCEIFIEKKNLPLAEQLLREYNSNIIKNGYDSEIKSEDRPVLEQVADYNQWRVSFLEDGASIKAPYDSIKGSDNASWLSAIAPVVRDGGYVQVSDDNGSDWRYMFQAGKCFQVFPKWA